MLSLQLFILTTTGDRICILTHQILKVCFFNFLVKKAVFRFETFIVGVQNNLKYYVSEMTEGVVIPFIDIHK